ncbi:DUF4056 domain-containing protein [Vibrio sp. T20]|uniref:DUF4056 domain-containing protein n=1 Tax=Vibrio sp. T20 TaxID=2588450 RepID=UPI0011B7BE32|nr:DUF4056 domain-containing protein [Vibrio sp. T20]
MKLIYKLSFFLSIISMNAFAIDPPTGVRPCCALGTGLKAELGPVPVPFFSLENVVDVSDLNQHKYNDGSESVTSSLFGGAEEKNGIIYTERGGFLDTAHIRDTADYTYYLNVELRKHLGKNYQIVLSDELRARIIQIYPQDISFKTEQERMDVIHNLSGLLAFRLAQWHEIAQWFGLESVGGFKEYASAFSTEDLYSNLIGAIIAIKILQKNPTIQIREYEKAFSSQLQTVLKKMGAVSKEKTIKELEAIDGQWWDSSERLPEKWVVKVRDYTLSLEMTPDFGDEPYSLSIRHLKKVEKLAELTLVSSESEQAFLSLPKFLKNKDTWTHEDFRELSSFAKNSDDKMPQSNNELLSE